MIFIIICLIIMLILYCIYKYYNNEKNLFYSSNDYPQFKIIEDNWKLIRDEIPDFDINNIKIKRCMG